MTDDDKQFLADFKTAATKDAFDSATYYDCVDAERFHCESVAEAIEELIDANSEPGETQKATLSRLADAGGIAVRAMARDDGPGDGDRDCQAQGFILALEEWWYDNWGDPDGGDAESVPEAHDMLRQGIDAWVAKQTVFMCEEVGTRTYTADEALAIVGEDPDGA